MKKRLRKKLRFKEFREDGFNLKFEHEETDLYLFFDEFIEFVESHNIGFGGACGNIWNGFITALGRGTMTRSHQQTIRDWLENRGTVKNIEVGPLIDAWHGWN